MRAAPSAKAGYALPAVLTVVTILTLIFMVCILSLENLRNETVATVNTAELERAALTAEARFAYLAATEPMKASVISIGDVRPSASDILTNTGSTAGVSGTTVVTPLKLDDAPYLWRETDDKAAARYSLSVQDLAGMINLDRIDHPAMLRLFRIIGVSDEVAERIADKLDAYRRPATPTSQERAASAPRPIAPNGLMRRYFEVFGVDDLSTALTPAQRRRLIDLTYLQPDTTNLNINTATPEALQTWFGVSDVDSAQILHRRATETFYSLGQIGVGAANDFGAYTFPSGRFRFSFARPGSQAIYRSFIVLTPGSFERPFWVEGARVQPSSSPATQRIDELQPFPPIPSPVSQP